MKGDFTRDTFHESKRYNRVRMQQGRVQLDADWNEQADIEAHLRETGVRDVVGPSGAPMDGGGFQITSATGVAGLVIYPGRLWVDGILCELAPGAAVPFTWALAPVGTGSGSGQPTDGGSVSAESAGAVSAVERRQSPPPQKFAVNLSVDDFHRLDVTLGDAAGNDSQGRLSNCQSNPDLWSQETKPPSGRMRARAVPEAAASDPCIVPAGSGFTGLENQLYRVEIHEGSHPADSTFIPTFKWSRDNGSIVTRWVDALTSGQVRVADPGRDSVLAFHQNDWVELIEDGAEADGRQTGELVKIDSIVDDL